MVLAAEGRPAAGRGQGRPMPVTMAGILSRGPRAFLPWAVLVVLLFRVGLWIVFQPVRLRGTALVGG